MRIFNFCETWIWLPDFYADLFHNIIALKNYYFNLKSIFVGFSNVSIKVAYSQIIFQIEFMLAWYANTHLYVWDSIFFFFHSEALTHHHCPRSRRNFVYEYCSEPSIGGYETFSRYFLLFIRAHITAFIYNKKYTHS